MSSEEIKTIYKKLVRRYVRARPHGEPLWVLNQHIEAYTRNVWKAREPAIIDLALREGVEIPKVEELIEKGRTRTDAILEVAENMKFGVSETEVKKWLEEPEMQKPERSEKVPRQRIKPPIEEYEKSIERLTTLFSKGEINEESYKIAVKRIERDMGDLRSGNGVSVTMPARTKPKKSYSYYEHTEPTRLWYIVPLFFGILGGLVAYVGVKDEDKRMAENLLVLGFFMTIVDAFLIYFWFWVNVSRLLDFLGGAFGTYAFEPHKAEVE